MIIWWLFLCRLEMMLYKLEIVDYYRRLQRDKDRLGFVGFVYGVFVFVVFSKEDVNEVFLFVNYIFYKFCDNFFELRVV